MIAEDFKLVQEVLDARLSFLAQELKEWSKSNSFKIIIQAGSWSNENILMAYISISPTGELTEETIDATIQLTYSEGKIFYEADVLYSNGRIIAEISNLVIEFLSKNDLVERIESQSLETVSRMAEVLKRILS